MRTKAVSSIELSTLSLAPGRMRSEGITSMELSLYLAVELILVTIINNLLKKTLFFNPYIFVGCRIAFGL